MVYHLYQAVLAWEASRWRGTSRMTGAVITVLSLVLCATGAMVPTIAFVLSEADASPPGKRVGRPHDTLLAILMVGAWMSAPFVVLGLVSVAVRTALPASITALIASAFPFALSIRLTLAFWQSRTMNGAGVVFSWGWFLLWTLTLIMSLLPLFVYFFLRWI